jgi:uncharacterized protein YqeY
MSFVDEISARIGQAMKAHDAVTLSTLRMLKTALTNKEVERGRALDAAESMAVVASVIKQRRDSIEQFKNAGRTDLVDKESAELKVLEGFLPPALAPVEIEHLVAEAITECGATSARDMGKAMKAHDAVTLSTLRMLKTALTNKEVERGRALDDN